MRKQPVRILEASIWLAIVCLCVSSFMLLDTRPLPFVPLEPPKPRVCTEALYKGFKLIGLAGDRLVLHSSVQNKIRFSQKASPENYMDFEVKCNEIRYQHPYVLYDVTKGIKRHDVVCKYESGRLTTIYDKERADELRHCRNEGIDKLERIWLFEDDERLGKNILYLLNISDGTLDSIKLHEKFPTRYYLEDNVIYNLNIYYLYPVLGLIVSESTTVFNVYYLLNDSICVTERERCYNKNCNSWPVLYPSSKYMLLREYQGIVLLSNNCEKVRNWFAERLEKVSYNNPYRFLYNKGELLLFDKEKIFYYGEFVMRYSYSHNMGRQFLAYEDEDSIIYQDASGKIIEIGFDLEPRELMKVSPILDEGGGILID